MLLSMVTPYKLISHENSNTRKLYFIIAMRFLLAPVVAALSTPVELPCLHPQGYE